MRSGIIARSREFTWVTKVMLEADDVNTFYGSSHILFGMTIHVESARAVCLLGRNGVGKTTMLLSIMGLVRPQSGSIRFKGTELVGKKPFAIARMGVGLVPEGRRIFSKMTVRENLEVAIKGSSLTSHWTLKRVYELFPQLEDRENHLGGMLSGGEQQMLSVARALMGNPELLLLDEPLEGLSPLIVKVLQNQISELKKQGLTILLSEQSMVATLAVGDSCYIIDKGVVCFQGAIAELKDKKDIVEKYLGV